MDPSADEVGPARRSEPEEYVVSVRGRIGAGLVDAFSPMVATSILGRTELRGLVEDQAALHGILAKIQTFGLELDEVKHAVTARDPIGE